MQLDPLNSSAYYLKSLTYYTKNDINNVTILFEKYTELLKLPSSDSNSLAKFQLFHLEYLLNKNSSKDLNNILTKINQIPYISENKLLLLIRCKIYIELNKYYEAKVDLDMLFKGYGYNEYYYKAFSYTHLLQKHSDFWSYLYKDSEIDKYDLTKLGIINEFSKYMYERLVLYSKNEKLRLDLPRHYKSYNYYLICKINVKKILSKDCFIKFIYENNEYNQSEHMLKHEVVSKLEGLGWIEYQDLKYSYGTQLSIEINSIEMQIDYVRRGLNPIKITPILNTSLMGYLLPDYHQFFSNVPV
ncbi:hypothetical protein RhiirA4_457559 [Rhizophagus irregularis]|uniref:Uncharacterized protein n=1 Tax=Rhizophagus irregularis TaxID=588596 RepID=A0A2I1GAA0_9GLOM|nr:hypothetical protein RhiirA4_457559 [Rhizophagus irregularis]